MEYVRLGFTNLEISRVGLGAMAFGARSWRDWILEEAEARPIIERALDAGINFFDSSDYYSGGESEVLLGRCLLARVAREQVVIATKVGNPMGPSATERGYSRKHIMHAVDASLRRLGSDYIDLYQTHIWDPETALEEMVAAFDDLIRAGKVRHVGITTMPAWQLAQCLATARSAGRRPFVSAQNHYNLVHREDERELIPLCRSEGIAVIPYSPLARGFLCGGRMPGGGPTLRARTDEFTHLWHGRRADFRVAKRVERIAARRGIPPAQVALAWVLTRPGVTAALFGATKTEHIDAAVEATSVTLNAAEVRSLESAYEPQALAGTREARGPRTRAAPGRRYR